MSSGALHRFGSLAVWLSLIAGLTFVFSWLLEKQHNPNQSNLVRISSDGQSEVVLARNRDGHYVATGEINGSAVQFLVDTGATFISIPDAQADELGLARGATMQAQTANGIVRVYATKLTEVKLGNIVLHNVPASINPGMKGPDILLGMSFLGHLEITQRADTLRLSVPQQDRGDG